MSLKESIQANLATFLQPASIHDSKVPQVFFPLAPCAWLLDAKNLPQKLAQGSGRSGCQTQEASGSVNGISEQFLCYQIPDFWSSWCM